MHNSDVSEKVLSEDGSIEYWRISPAVPTVYTKFFKKRYVCMCGKKFSTKDKYELHYRKATYEERNFYGQGTDTQQD